MTTKREPKPCTCGCGEWTRGGRFVPGHDAKYHSAQRKLYAQARELVEDFRGKPDGFRWLARAAQAFGGYEGETGTELAYRNMAVALLTHPRMQDTDYNRRNGYRPYCGPDELFSRICRRCS